jgi:hypothetical protein
VAWHLSSIQFALKNSECPTYFAAAPSSSSENVVQFYDQNGRMLIEVEVGAAKREKAA